MHGVDFSGPMLAAVGRPLPPLVRQVYQDEPFASQQALVAASPRVIAARELPERFVERNDEHLFLARRA